MVNFCAGGCKKGPIVNAVKQIIGMICGNPDLFTVVVEVITTCHGYSNSFEEKIDLICKSVPKCSSTDSKRLKGYLSIVYSCDQSNWGVDMRRGYVVEELVATLKSKKLGLTTNKGISVKREAWCQVDGQQICGRKKIDVVFQAEKEADGIECKANLDNWISDLDSAEKLKYMVTLRSELSRVQYSFKPWLGTFKPNNDRWRSILNAGGFSEIGIICRETFERALNLAG